MILQRADSRMINVMATVSAFIQATGKRDYQPEQLAALLYYHPVTMAEAMHRLGFLDRRGFERRVHGEKFTGRNDRRDKERRGDDFSS